jgi:tetratricopeptide (TPR) repeat protein
LLGQSKIYYEFNCIKINSCFGDKFNNIELLFHTRLKIFISYSRRDAGDFAEQIKRHFSSFNYEIFIDDDSIRGGDIWNKTIEDNISTCDIFVVIVTFGALQSSHVEKEVLHAEGKKKRIIPCIHKDVRKHEIKWGLNDIQGIKFKGKFELVRDLYPKIALDQNGKNEGNITFGSSDGREPKEYEIESENVMALLDSGRSLNEKGKYLEAIQYFNKVLDIEPKNVMALSQKGYSLAKSGKHLEAIQYFNKVLDIEPKNVMAWSNKGYSYRRLGNNEDANICYEEAKKWEPKNKNKIQSIVKFFKNSDIK